MTAIWVRSNRGNLFIGFNYYLSCLFAQTLYTFLMPLAVTCEIIPFQLLEMLRYSVRRGVSCEKDSHRLIYVLKTYEFSEISHS